MRIAYACCLAALVVQGASTRHADAEEGTPGVAPTFTISPIGRVRKDEGETKIVLDKKYAPGLLGLDGFSHVYVIWWFDKNDTPQKRGVLQVHPRGDDQNPLTGVFATRSPVRPNLTALALCKIVSIKDNVVQIDKIEAFDRTPVIDMKPFIPGADTAKDVKLPDWLGRK